MVLTVDLPDLYEHQQKVRDDVREALSKHRRVILCAPPGMGKTRTAKWILGAAAMSDPGTRQSGLNLFAVHRRGLVDNASNSFGEEPALPHGIIMSGRPVTLKLPVQVASIDSILSWFVEADEYTSKTTFDLVVFDECHSHHSKLQRFLDAHDAKRRELGLGPAYVIGLSATPQAKGLADVYRKIVLGPDTQWLIDNGFLSPFRYVQAKRGNLDVLKRRGGDYTPGSVAEAFDGLAGDLVRDWKRFAHGRATVGFFPRRSHAMDAMELLRAEGIRTEYVDGETPDEDRHRIFAALNDGEIDYLCNVQIVERGTDIPRIGCVQLCVAIGNVVRYRQMIGRGSRMHAEKNDCLVIDHADNVRRLGFFEDDPHWNLDSSENDAGTESVRPTIECPNCSAIYRGGKCKQCGYEPTRKQVQSQGLEFDGDELIEIQPTERKKPKGKSPEELMVSALYRAGRSGRTWKQAVGIYKSMAREQGDNFRVPKRVTIGGHSYEMVRFGSPDGSRRVSALFPFTAGGEHGGDYYEG